MKKILVLLLALSFMSTFAKADEIYFKYECTMEQPFDDWLVRVADDHVSFFDNDTDILAPRDKNAESKVYKSGPIEFRSAFVFNFDEDNLKALLSLEDDAEIEDAEGNPLFVNDFEMTCKEGTFQEQ